MRYSVFVKQANLIKSRLETLKGQVSDLKEGDVLPEKDVAKLKTINETATKQNSSFDSIVQKLFRSESACDEIDEDELQSLQNAISDSYLFIHSICNRFAPAEPKLEQTAAASLNSSVQNDSSLGIKLPRLNLGVFSGQLEKWIAFHSLYENSVHNNNTISDVEKFSYLLSSLNGEPLKLIKSLPVTSVNYNIAWTTLLKRYHNSRALIALHVNNLLDIPAVTRNSVHNLRNFLSTYHENVSALKALNHDVQESCLILTSFLLRKFDYEFRSKFEHGRKDSQAVPKITELIEFIETECSQLEAADLASYSPKPRTNPQSSRQTFSDAKSAHSRAFKTALLTSDDHNCAYCSSNEHSVFRCPEFNKITPEARLSFIKGKHLCTNCLGRHSIHACKSMRNCYSCGLRHHSLLHFHSTGRDLDKAAPPVPSASYRNKTGRSNDSAKNTDNRPPLQSKLSDTSRTTHSNAHDDKVMVGTSIKNDSTILLATALVKISHGGHSTVARAVLDSAAQHSFITENCANLIRAHRCFSDTSQISGISASAVKTKGLCHVNLASLNGCILASNHPVLILDKITGDLPRTTVDSTIKLQLKNLVLADPAFDTPAPIDILIGADLFALAIRDRSFSLGMNMPTAFDTIFGFVLLGTTPITASQSEPASNAVTLLTLNESNLLSSIQRFWILEEPPPFNKITPPEQECENHFISTHKRSPSGRYIVRLPLKDSPSRLGDSSKNAMRIFNSLEKRLETNCDLRSKYIDFMRDYNDSGHMVECHPDSLFDDSTKYFLPHHGVMRDGKLRVVFNASAPTSTGISLNDLLHQGRKLHNEIPDIILHFRRFKIVFTCDIKQMFRQISVHEEDQLLQLLYWRELPTQPLKIFRLTTVTYGMASSPYLANRAVQQLIADEGHAYPAAASALRSQLYVDDALLGSDNVDDALKLQQEVIDLLSKGGFSLRKWTSNCDVLLNAIPQDHRGSPLSFPSADQPFCNVLGLKWLPEMDVFSYLVSLDKNHSTKRSVLSTVSRIYDPMGWLTPVVFWAKSLMQHLWTLGLQWDDPLSSDISESWTTFTNELPLLQQIKIPRHLGITADAKCQLHGFSDASELGFSACVYLRVENKDSEVSIHLMIGKSRVAPLRRVSLPRLELCGAQLLATLLNYCHTELIKYVNIDQIYAWSDSNIALSWIKTPPYRLKTYVANRVAEIQSISFPTMWSHIPSKENPADCGSRGLLPSMIKDHPLWWTGPKWLSLSSKDWPQYNPEPISEDCLPETKKPTLATLTTTDSTSFELLQKFSSWTKLVRVLAYVIRFINNCKPDAPSKQTGTLTVSELNSSTNKIFKLIQMTSLSEELKCLRSNRPCSARIQRLSPFIDEEGLIRAGGRLKNSHLPYGSKHPIILPKDHPTVTLLVDFYHLKYLHAPPQLLQSLLSQHVWILSSRSLIRSRIHKCIRCFRAKPRNSDPLMGDLPEPRVTPSRPFLETGIDFCGPFTAKAHTLRNIKKFKIYICVFVCFSTKAVHLELVSDLSTEAFIAALTRFVSRRGLCKTIHCDNGTNFVGADAQLSTFIKSSKHQRPLSEFLAQQSIEFRFNPPSAPHQGGLWEAAVKSMKYHLRRVVGNEILTMEEYSTVTAKIEAILNSRPLVPASSDPNDCSALTPGHFLIGAPLTAVPESNLEDSPIHHLKRWQRLQAFTQHIWKRWCKDYLHTLQQRTKWNRQVDNLKVGDLVVLQDVQCAPLNWPLGRISSIHPGTDGTVRVIKVQLPNNKIYTRPAIKVYPLPNF